MPFDPEIHDVTGYAKADIIKLQNTAFKDNVKCAKKVKGALLGLPSGSIPTIQQINSSVVCPPHTTKGQIRGMMMMMRKDLQRRLTSTISGYLSFKGIRP